MNKFGFFSMLLLCLNGMIGTGIFLLPGTISFLTGGWGPLIFLAVALLVMAIAWNFTQCSMLFSKNGGPYLYAKEAFGSFIGFEIGLMRWIVTIISWASLAVGFSTIFTSLAPSFSPYLSLLSIGIIFLFGTLNLFGMGIFKPLSNLFSIAKIATLLLFIILGMFLFSAPLVELPIIQLENLGSAALLVFYAFGGFEVLPSVAAETENPRKNIPRIIPLSIALTALLYVLVQSVCFFALQGLHSATPISDIMHKLFGPMGFKIVSIATLISTIGGLLSLSFLSPRSSAAMAEDGLLPPSLFHKNRFEAPFLSIILSMSLASLVTLGGNFIQLAAISVISRFAQYISTILALFIFNRKKLLTPFQNRWKLLIPLFSLGGIGYLLTQANLQELLFGFGGLLLGIPLYFLYYFPKKRSADKIPSL